MAGQMMTEVPFLNLLAASWIQFMNGDWINHGEILFEDVIEVPLPQDDPARSRYRQSKMFIGKTQPDPTRVGDREPAATSSINEVTHWWDGSQIYGSDQATQNRLRSGRLGKMRVNNDGTLPVDSTGVEDTGFRRNWWVGLSMLHTLFVREHNAICDMLHEAYPDWDDNRLFNVARLINAAVMAKIHSIEWTPAILPNPALNIGLNVNWYGLLTFVAAQGQGAKDTVRDQYSQRRARRPRRQPDQQARLRIRAVRGIRRGLPAAFDAARDTAAAPPWPGSHRRGGALFRDAPEWLGPHHSASRDVRPVLLVRQSAPRERWCSTTFRASCRSSVSRAIRSSTWARWISCAHANAACRVITSSAAS